MVGWCSMGTFNDPCEKKIMNGLCQVPFQVLTLHTETKQTPRTHIHSSNLPYRQNPKFEWQWSGHGVTVPGGQIAKALQAGEPSQAESSAQSTNV